MKKKSAVCLIAKNEGPYLLEWVGYHRLLGFDEIFVYDNVSTDNSDHLLTRLARSKIINYRVWRVGAKQSPQITAYKDALRRTRSEWVLFIDADEFLVLHQHSNVNEFLSAFDGRQEVGAIGMNWRLFGDSNQPSPDGRLVTERFTRAATKDFGVNAHLKSFVRVKQQRGMVHMHMCDTVGKKIHPSGAPLTMNTWGVSETIEVTVAQVNHYYTKTIEEYQIKKARGQAGCSADHPDKYYYHDEAFHAHNRNDVEELSIQRSICALKNEIEFLRKVAKL